MNKKVLVLLCFFGLFGCSDASEEKFISYCLNEFNQYEAIPDEEKVTNEECRCIYTSLSQKLSPSQINELITVDKEPLLTQEQMLFILSAKECLKS